MLIFRVEDKCGNGPYRRGDNLASLLANKHNGDSSHPTPILDGIENRQNYFCGFKDLDQLFNWFNPYTEILKKAGFAVSVYEIDKEYVLEGNYQVCFRRSFGYIEEIMEF